MDSAHFFGDYGNLMGVIHHPADSSSNPRVGVIMLTPGMLHHVGPSRLHVDLARKLGELGISSLRFDLSGIGESLAVGGGGTSLQRAEREVVQAMDFFQSQTGIDRFVLFGLCSGADDSLPVALNDSRVVALSMMDGCGYKTWRFYANKVLSKYLPKVFRWDKWKAKFLKRIQGKVETPSTLQMGSDIREFPSRNVAANQLQTLIDRGVLLQFIYTAGVSDYFSYERQFRDMFYDVDFRDQESYHYFSNMDHVAMLKEDREKIVSVVSQWCQRVACHTEFAAPLSEGDHIASLRTEGTCVAQ